MKLIFLANEYFFECKVLIISKQRCLDTTNHKILRYKFLNTYLSLGAKIVLKAQFYKIILCT